MTAISSISASVMQGTSLSISVSGTANLQKMIANGTLPGANPSDGQGIATASASAARMTGAQALAKASEATREVIQTAVEKFDTNGSIAGYKDGQSFTNAFGGSLDIIA